MVSPNNSNSKSSTTSTSVTGVPRLPVVAEESSDASTQNSSVVILAEGSDEEDYGDVSQQHPQQPSRRSIRPLARGLAAAAASLPHTTFSTITSYASSSSAPQEERTLAALAGATAVTTGPDSFTVSVDLAGGATNSTTDTVQDVLDVIGNPDLLRLWCTGVDGPVVIVRSSEGSRNAVTRRPVISGTDNDRAYEGEWIEATAPLVAPGRRGLWSGWTSSLASALGFPSHNQYGPITMFVERWQGRVSLTLGPLTTGCCAAAAAAVCKCATA